MLSNDIASTLEKDARLQIKNIFYSVQTHGTAAKANPSYVNTALILIQFLFFLYTLLLYNLLLENCYSAHRISLIYHLFPQTNLPLYTTFFAWESVRHNFYYIFFKEQNKYSYSTGICFSYFRENEFAQKGYGIKVSTNTLYIFMTVFLKRKREREREDNSQKITVIS